MNTWQRLEVWLRDDKDGRVMDYLGLSYADRSAEAKSCTCLLRGETFWRAFGPTLEAAVTAALDAAGAPNE